MATVITAEPLRGGGSLNRVSVNGHQFIEAVPLRGGGALADIRVGSSNDVIHILGWTPADNSTDNEIGGSVEVNFETENTAVHDVDLSEAADVDANGTHNQTVATTGGISLDTDAPNLDFENYILNTSIDAVTQPDEWTWLGGTAAWKWVARSNAFSWDGQHIDILTGSGGSWTGFTGGGTFTSATYSLDVYHDSTGGTSGPTMAVGHQLRGSGTALRGYCAEFGTGQYLSLKRVNSATYHYGVGSINWGYGPEDTLYHVKFKFVNNGVTTWLYAKKWLDTQSEPASFTYVGGDTAYASVAGWTGLYHKSGSGNYRSLADNFKIEPDPAEYHTSGDWQSDPLDVSPAETKSSAYIEYDVTTPTDTTAAVKCRWRNTDTWLTCSPGAALPGIPYRSDMREGSTFDAIELKVELTTTDTTVTPVVENLVVNFEPCDFRDVEIEVDGDSATEANGHLLGRGKEQVSAGVEIIAYDDLTAAAFGFHSYKLHAEALIAKFIYAAEELDSIIYSQLRQAFWIAPAATGYFGYTGASGAAETSPNQFDYTVRDEWMITGKTFEWVIIDKSQAIHADGWFWIGHAQADDFPGSVIVAQAEENDFPGSVIANAYRRNDFPGSALVQGYRMDDFPGSVLPYLENLFDFPGSVVVAVGKHDDFPGSVVVYGVNRNNHIEVHAIDQDTRDALEAAGFVFPAEV